jgi:diguanylate cyclase (GGDEF)-like protein
LSLSDLACELFGVENKDELNWSQIAPRMTEESEVLFSTLWAKLIDNTSTNEVIYLKYFGHDNRLFDFKVHICRYHTPKESKDYIAGTVKDVTDKTHQIDEIKHLAFDDFITNLPNRSYFINLVKKDLKTSNQIHFSILCINIDDFKVFNSKHGFENGNRMLNHIANALQSTYEDGRVSRIYSDTFAIFMDNKRTLEKEVIYIQNALKNIAMLYFNELNFSATIGAIRFTRKLIKPFEELLLDAEKNIYLARDTQKGSYLIS